jgi:hypothetical protein
LAVYGALCEHGKKCSEVLRATSLSKGRANSEDSDYLEGCTNTSGSTSKATPNSNATSNSTSTSAPRADPTMVSSLKSGISASHEDELCARRDIAHIKSVTAGTLNGACYATAMFALNLPEPKLQIRAVQALCGVFIGCPRLMLLTQESGLLERLLSEEYPSDVHESLLIALKNMMMAEEVNYILTVDFDQLAKCCCTILLQASPFI